MAYKPPRQSGIGQVIDSLLILVVLFICLLVPFRWDAIVAALAPAPAAETVAAEMAKAPDATRESLKQTPIQAQQWEKLGKKPTDAKPLIDAKFDFDADLRSWKLPLTIIDIVLLVLCVAVYFATYLGYTKMLLSIKVFYILASLWFAYHRYQYVKRGDQFTMAWPRPKGY